MRKLLCCVPMMMLLLAGCGPAGVSEAEELALAIRGEYLEMASGTAQLTVTADYGRRVYRYEMTALWEGEETELTLTTPETVAGVVARSDGEDSQLEYSGVAVETGPLDSEGLTPVSAVPALLEAARSGYMRSCGLQEDGALRVDLGDPEGSPGTGREMALWFDPATHALLRGEIRVDGFRAILCEFSSFTWNG